jgi:hypothetical protein
MYARHIAQENRPASTSVINVRSTGTARSWLAGAAPIVSDDVVGRSGADVFPKGASRTGRTNEDSAVRGLT